MKNRKPAYADIPKYKKLEHQLRAVIIEIQTTIGQMETARGNKYELGCLEASAEECEMAVGHLRNALHELYNAFDKPDKGKAAPKS